MMNQLKYALPVLLSLAAASAPAQFYKLKGVSVSVGGFGNYTEQLSYNGSPFVTNVPSGAGTLRETVVNQGQDITSSVGFLTSLQFHPVPWAGVEMNYGYQHYSERYTFSYQGSGTQQTVKVPTTTHEATAAYVFHPKHIPFQPFVNIGGGAIDFVPTAGGQNQWRGAGLLETGFDIAMPNTGRRLKLRLEGRGLFYRAPNFNSTALSTRSWRVNAEPTASFVYSF